MITEITGDLKIDCIMSNSAEFVKNAILKTINVDRKEHKDKITVLYLNHMLHNFRLEQEPERKFLLEIVDYNERKRFTYINGIKNNLNNLPDFNIDLFSIDELKILYSILIRHNVASFKYDKENKIYY